ncbi:hypothetical protein, partial [Streptomyces decoyicus]|uniref:hypothetical protein n=1 Tax=Streptomyces decoyicus TaxID=249567 RepID=UPI003F4BCD47
MSADDGGVDLDEPVDVAGRVRLGLYVLESPGEHAVQGITAKARVDRLRTWSVDGRQVGISSVVQVNSRADRVAP